MENSLAGSVLSPVTWRREGVACFAHQQFKVDVTCVSFLSLSRFLVCGWGASVSVSVASVLSEGETGISLIIVYSTEALRIWGFFPPKESPQTVLTASFFVLNFLWQRTGDWLHRDGAASPSSSICRHPLIKMEAVVCTNWGKQFVWFIFFRPIISQLFEHFHFLKMHSKKLMLTHTVDDCTGFGEK